MTLKSPLRRIVVRPVAAWYVAGALIAGAAFAADARGQRPDTTRAPARDTARALARDTTGATPTLRDTVVRPPLSPRRAFLASLVAPGYGQSVLGRPNASALFVLTEAIALLMVRESSVELREARRLEGDSVPLFFVNPATGDPDTIFGTPRYSSALVRSRRAHLEDWIAALVANHLISAADAFVAAHLWEVPVRVGLRRTADRVAVAAGYRW